MEPPPFPYDYPGGEGTYSRTQSEPDIHAPSDFPFETYDQAQQRNSWASFSEFPEFTTGRPDSPMRLSPDPVPSHSGTPHSQEQWLDEHEAGHSSANTFTLTPDEVLEITHQASSLLGSEVLEAGSVPGLLNAYAERVTTLTWENAQLTKENAQFTKENAQLTKENDHLTKGKEKYKVKYNGLKDKVKSLEDEVESLKMQQVHAGTILRKSADTQQAYANALDPRFDEDVQ